MVEVGRDLWRSSGPAPLLRVGHGWLPWDISKCLLNWSSLRLHATDHHPLGLAVQPVVNPPPSAHAAHASTARVVVPCELTGVLQPQCSAQMTTQTLYGKIAISMVKFALHFFFLEVHSARVV